MVAVASSFGSRHGSGSRVEREQLGVGVGADHEAVLGLHVAERVVELGVDQQHRGAGVLDDVAHLVGIQTEVDGHEDAAVAAHAPERAQQARRVLRDHGDPFTLADAEAVEAGGLRPRQLGEAGVGELAPRLGGLVRLVDHADTTAVDELCPIQEIGNGQRKLHERTPKGSVGWTVSLRRTRHTPIETGRLRTL